MTRGRCCRALRAAGRRAAAFCGAFAAVRAGDQYRYSSYGWILVSAAVEAAAHEPFLAFMRKQIFEPLGMDDTRADSATEPIPDRATFYFPRFAANPRYGLHLMRQIDYSCYAGSSAFLSTPSDLVRFAMATNSGKLLQPATVQLLQTSQRLTSGQETGYGLGWDLETATLAGKESRLVGHDGESLGGMVASFMTFPELRDRRVRDVEHLVRGHVRACGENRAGVRRTGEKSSTQVTRRSLRKSTSRIQHLHEHRKRRLVTESAFRSRKTLAPSSSVVGDWNPHPGSPPRTLSPPTPSRLWRRQRIC